MGLGHTFGHDGRPTRAKTIAGASGTPYVRSSSAVRILLGHVPEPTCALREDRQHDDCRAVLVGVNEQGVESILERVLYLKATPSRGQPAAEVRDIWYWGAAQLRCRRRKLSGKLSTQAADAHLGVDSRAAREFPGRQQLEHDLVDNRPQRLQLGRLRPIRDSAHRETPLR